MLPDKTLTQLRAQLVPDKRSALIAINGGDKIADEPIRKYREDGQIEYQSETLRDVETGEIVSVKEIHWTYYKGGEVDEITITENGKNKTIKHYLDKQPEVIK